MTIRNEQTIHSESINGQVRVRIWHDRAKFINIYSEFWRANEAENIAFLRLSPQSSTGDSICVSLHDELGNTKQTAFLKLSEQIIISNAAECTTSALCNYLVRNNLDVPGLFAPVPTSRTAAKILTKLTGMQYTLVKELLHLELRQPPRRRSVTGVFRAAKSQDTEQLILHRKALQDESNTQRPFDSAQSVWADLQDDALYIWVDNSNRIVASGSLYHAHTPTSSYFNHVYVEPKYRRQGYAAALVSKLCECAIEWGSVSRLSVDVKNQAACQLYLQIGFVVAARMDNFRVQV